MAQGEVIWAKVDTTLPLCSYIWPQNEDAIEGAVAGYLLRGVMQASSGPDEDPTGGFAHGGWTAPDWDDVVGQATAEGFGRPFDLLLGRKTYDIFARSVLARGVALRAPRARRGRA